MSKITAIEPQKKRQGRFNIYVDGEFSFALSAEALVKANLIAGQEITGERVGGLILENEAGKLFDRALHFLSYRPHSEKEVRDFLAKKEAGPQTLAIVLEKLKKLNFVNDVEFANWWIEQRLQFRPQGKKILSFELYKKGVNRDIIDKVFEEKSFDQEGEKSLAQKALSKKVKTWGNLSDKEFFKKAAGFLQRRGFSWSVAKSVIDNIRKKE